MQKYKYVAVNLSKEKITGIFIANDEKDLAVQLSKQNLFLVSATPYKGVSAASTFFTLGTGKVSVGELTTFCRQFSIMINSGMSILSTLDCLRAQKYSQLFHMTLDVVFEDVKAGVMLSDAMNKHENVFPDFFRSMIFVGEASGKLDSVLNSLADYYENDSKMRRNTKSAMSYSVMLCVMTVAIVIAMMVYIVPTFRESLSSLDVKPEGITKVVYDISDFCLENWQTMFLVAILVGGGIFLFGKTERGKYIFDVIAIKVPLLGKVNVDLITARFARGFGLLLAGGLDVVEALEAIVIVLGNRDMQRRFRLATNDVKQGKSLAFSLDKQKIFPEILTQMVAVGEKTASINDVLSRSCSFFDEQAQATLTAVTSKLQPIILMILGGIIGVLFIAIYSPMLSIMTQLV